MDDLVSLCNLILSLKRCHTKNIFYFTNIWFYLLWIFIIFIRSAYVPKVFPCNLICYAETENRSPYRVFLLLFQLEFLSLTGKVEGKRDRGQQRITFLDSLCNSATGGQSKGLNFLKLSDDRDVWRGMVANVCSRSGTWWWWWCRNVVVHALSIQTSVWVIVSMLFSYLIHFSHRLQTFQSQSLGS